MVLLDTSNLLLICIASHTRRETAKDDAYMPLESLYSVVPILADISQDGNDVSGVKADNIDRLILERNLDLINQVRAIETTFLFYL